MSFDKAVDIYFGITFAAIAFALAALSTPCLYVFFTHGWDRLPGLFIGVFLLLFAGATGIMSWTCFRTAGK
jgi:hypothetical protein